MKKVSIIIPTCNYDVDCLSSCLSSIWKYTNLDDIEIIVVANGCKDNTKQIVSEYINKIKLLWFDEPLGFSKAINEGIKISNSEYIILLNDDTILLEQKKDIWINMLFEPFLDNKVGITGPIKQIHPLLNKEFIIFFCAMIKREVIDKVGLLDETFKVGGSEDIDYCIRTQQVEYKLIQVPYDISYDKEQGLLIGGFPIYHKGEATVKEIKNWKEIFNNNDTILKNKYNISKKLNLGCGDMIMKEYINCDLYSPLAEVNCDVRSLPFEDNSVDEIYACHIIEHFHFHEGINVLKEWRRVLKKGGILKIETPDLLESCKKFVISSEEDRINILYSNFFGMGWLPGGAHLFLYTPNQLRWTLEQCNFKNIEQIPALRYIGRESISLGMRAIK